MNSTKTAAQRPNPEGASRNLASISPFFIVKDLQASISHYIERFGFQPGLRSPATGLGDDPKTFGVGNEPAHGQTASPVLQPFLDQRLP